MKLKRKILIHILLLILITIPLDSDLHAQYELNIYSVKQKDSSEIMSPYNLMATYITCYLREQLKNEASEYKVNHVESSGSLHTLISIDNSQVPGIGIVQSDVLYHYLHGVHNYFPVTRKNSNIRAISKLFQEWIFVYTDNVRYSHPNQVPLQTIKEVNGGQIGSGHLVTTINIGKILQLPWDSYFASSEIKPECQDTVVSIRVYSPGNKLMSEKKDYLIFLDDGSSKILNSSFANVYEYIDNQTLISKYSNDFIIRGNRTTVALNSILVVHKDLDDHIVDLISNKMFNTFYDTSPISEFYDTLHMLRNELLDNVLSLRDTTYLANRTDNLPIIRHHFLVKQNIDFISRTISKIIKKESLKILAIFIAILLILRYYLPVLKSLIKQPTSFTKSFGRFLKPTIILLKYSMIFVTFHIVIAALVWLSEYYYSDQLLVDDKFITDGIPGAILWIVDYLTINNSKIIIHSTMAMFWIALLKSAYAISTATLTFTSARKIYKYIKQKKMKNHIVIIGWNEIINNIIKELKRQNIENFMLISAIPPEKTNFAENLSQYYIQKQNLAESFGLAHVEHAMAVIVLTDEEWTRQEKIGNVDLNVLRILEELKNYLNGSKNPPRIVAEVEKYDNKKLARSIFADEVICRNTLGNELLAHCATKDSFSKIFEELLLTFPTNNEIYYDPLRKLDLPSDVKNFGHLRRFYNKYNPDRIPLGLFTNSEPKIKLNPDNTMPIDRKTDCMIVLAHTKLKNIKSNYISYYDYLEI